MTHGPDEPAGPRQEGPARRWPATTALGGVVLAVAGLFVAGRLAREGLVDHPRHALEWSAVQCPAPPGLSARDFLAEVQYLGKLPDRLPSLAADTPNRLRDAFARHPWVESVRSVALAAGPKVTADLVFRKPVLLVSRYPNADPPGRAADAAGVSLPHWPGEAELPVLAAEVAAPAGPAGSAWGDETVRRATALAALLAADADLPRFAALEVGPDGWVLRAKPAGPPLVWGAPPGAEPAGEATAPLKLSRLRRLFREQSAGAAVDLRVAIP